MDLSTIAAVIIMIFGLGIFVRAWVKGNQSMKTFDKHKNEPSE
ncbi:hypothetical protein [Polynucleobacter kasalickyi]|uniref:Uncharacterized protein n=1 Tax=Polynucleobacter kasalickyi TaxID=1938817 RepID=A0A1W1Z0B5_9BURK|nr:hypothetical protein [Polynucleobacter kasalickyi]SMC41880.1 hypothetical protein SAMN06296008_10460 [Polynucleobacter kasalickyi]